MIKPLSLFLLAVLPLSLTANEAPPVPPPAVRTKALGVAREVVRQREATLPANVADPFSEANPGAPDAGKPKASSESTESAAPGLLAQIANTLRPSGTIVSNGKTLLLIGGKRVTVGGKVPATFEGTEYTLEITAITRTHFTVALKGETYTRTLR